jgi:hypothetical protein
VGFCKSVVNIGTQCVQWQPTLQVPFAARDFGAVEAARHAHFDALAAKA